MRVKFGGGLWWFDNNGENNRKTSVRKRPFDFFRLRNGVFVMVGLAHMSLDSGKIYQVEETAEEVRVTKIADLGGSPRGFNGRP